MKIINLEIYSLLFSITIFIDYYFRFKYKLTDTSRQFLRLLIYIVVLSILNISMTLIVHNNLIRYILLGISFVVAYLPPYVIYEYIEENYLLSKYYIENKNYIKVLYFLCVMVSLAFVFIRIPNYTKVPSFISGSGQYNFILLFSIIPIFLIFLEYLHCIVYDKRRKNARIFLIILFCILGILSELYFLNYSFFTMTYIISAFLLYSYRYEVVVNRDILTNLYNREILKKLEYDKRNNDKVLVLYMIDVDKFKKINDTFGHDKGDVVLQKVAKILLSSTRHNDYVIRFGGDEFIIIAELQDIKYKDVILNKINDNLKYYNKTNKIPIGLSIGYEEIKKSKGKNEIFKTIEKADVKMYEEKEKRKKAEKK